MAKVGAPLGSKNALKAEKERRVMISIRLSPHVFEWLKQKRDVTKTIETALIEYYGIGK